MKKRFGLIAVALGAAACATVQKPAELTQAEQIQAQLQSSGASERVDAELLRARDAIQAAQKAVDSSSQEYANGMAHVALRTVQVAQAENDRTVAERRADSLRNARLTRLLSMSEAQRSALLQQQQLSASEIEALRARNMLVSQQADSLRRANEAANAALNQALTQLQTVVKEVTNLRETSRGLVISLSDILFDVNRATLRPGSEANVRRIAAILKQYPNHNIAVEGHTDATGGDAYNQRLSEDRAASVRAALVAGGVDPSIITSRGFGKTQPVATNATTAGRQQNRRVEIVVLGAGRLADVSSPGAAGGAGTPTTPTNPGTGIPPTNTTTVRDSTTTNTTIRRDSTGAIIRTDSMSRTRDSTSTRRPPR